MVGAVEAHADVHEVHLRAPTRNQMFFFISSTTSEFEGIARSSTIHTLTGMQYRN